MIIEGIAFVVASVPIHGELKESNFFANSFIMKMTLQEKIYYSICITKNRYKFSYGRKPKRERLKEILLTSSPPLFVYKDIFNEVFDSWKKIIK